MYPESRKKQLLDELQSYKDDRIRQRDDTVSAIVAKRDRQIKKTNAKLQEDLKAIDNEILSFRKKQVPEFKLTGRRKTVQKSGGTGRKSTQKSKGGRKASGGFKWIKFLLCLPFSVTAFLVRLVFSLILFPVRFLIHLIKTAGVKRYNKKIDARISSLKKKKASLSGAAQSEIKRLENQAAADFETAREDAKRDVKRKEKKIEDEISKIRDDYKKEAAQFAGKLISTPSRISPLIDHIMSVFKSMDYDVKHEPLIKLDLKFEVTKERLIFDFDESDPRTGGKKIQDEERNLLFFKEGLSNLTKDSECEGMAMALAQTAKEKMEETSPTMMVTFDLTGAVVTIHTKDINPDGRLL